MTICYSLKTTLFDVGYLSCHGAFLLTLLLTPVHKWGIMSVNFPKSLDKFERILVK